MPSELRAKCKGKQGIHSAVMGYSKDGIYGADDKAKGRSMDIRPSDEANKQHTHPLIRSHPETGQLGIFGTLGAYIIGFDGMTQDEALAFLYELQAYQTQEEFIYRHKWQKNMLLLWDNRSVLHRATGGYEGHSRLLHRITIAA